MPLRGARDKQPWKQSPMSSQPKKGLGRGLEAKVSRVGGAQQQEEEEEEEKRGKEEGGEESSESGDSQ
ncbi:hypothetical protein E2C01_084091 [Portunus trituberculatus]|uniref:Uncharacterized protein n=1 Tax=Portunus trituberculatus TaxID=210409 RepID=A0A5B7J6I8_PORTR|nr:hypothetical protein [Portunus trituberculatus]